MINDNNPDKRAQGLDLALRLLAEVSAEMDAVRYVDGAWYVYGQTRVLGPFLTEQHALRALKAEKS